ncbi:hypothetical protein PR202_ga22912 [Eleusine coracana subsp. coracana]|uniref:Uncharacterized protein n=1 Tax=Eleusine coracana subsp. coracana TaxID=191504 RepID=A0AAV5D2X5_ELECO|nr:hypothetical protein PR202_ga22912 [Eleusine coracana subsp. coracana]
MLRRNPTRIEVCSSDRDELEERHRTAFIAKVAAGGTTPATSASTTPVTPSPEAGNTLLQLLHPPHAPSKAHRVGLATTPTPSPTIPWRSRASIESLVAPPLHLSRAPPPTIGETSSSTTTTPEG